MKRNSLYIALFVTLLVVLGACSPKATPTPSVPNATVPAVSGADTAWQKVVEAAKREGKLALYDGGILAGDPSVILAKAFRDRYGITIDYVSGVGADLVERLKTERRMGVMAGDVYFSSITVVLMAKKEGMTVPLTDLPELKNKDVWAISPTASDPDGHALGMDITYYFQWVNTKLVKQGEAPRKWRDLLDPQWKDKKIVSTDPALNSGLYLNFVPLLNAKIIDTGFLAALGKQNMRVETSTNRSLEVLSRGEAPVNLVAASVTANQFVAQGAPIAPLVMDEGTTVLSASALVMMNAAPNPNSARLFANWLLSSEGQDIYSRAKVSRSLRKDVHDYSPVWVAPKRVVVPDLAAIEQTSVMFKDKAFVPLWGK